jgi:aryl-alcohol dehydrogenase-like predicted oxidoreductase
MIVSPESHETVRRVVEVAKELGCTPAQVAIAWCAKNPHVSTVVTGASNVKQVHENMEALRVIPLLGDDMMARLEGRS